MGARLKTAVGYVGMALALYLLVAIAWNISGHSRSVLYVGYALAALWLAWYWWESRRRRLRRAQHIPTGEVSQE